MTSNIVNPSFETGTTEGWTIPPAAVSATVTVLDDGTHWLDMGSAVFGSVDIMQTDSVPVWEGKSITASCYWYQGTAKKGHNTGQVILKWYDSSGSFLSENVGSTIKSSNGGSSTSSVTATAPAGAGAVRIGARINKDKTATCALDAFNWDFNPISTIELTYPVDGATYSETDSIPFRSSVTANVPVVQVEYVVTNVSTSEQYFSATSTEADTYPVNDNNWEAGTYSVVANLTTLDGVVTTSDEHIITIGTPPAPLTREYKASNAYTYLIAKKFVGIANSMPPTANVTGVEVILDYTIEAIIRSKDKDVEDLYAATYAVAFDIAPSITFDCILLNQDNSVAGGSNTAQVDLNRSDFSVVEDMISENKRFTSLESSNASVTIGGESQLFDLDFITASEFVDKSIGIRAYPTITGVPSYADSGDAVYRIKIDGMHVRVYFDAGSVYYYFASPAGNDLPAGVYTIKGRLAAAYVDSGDLTNGDAAGIFQLASDIQRVGRDNIGNCAILDGYTIHSNYPITDANKIGVVSGDMTYNGLPCYWDVEDNRSRYQMISANFYGDLTYDSIYGVNGVDRAFAYNGDFFYKIHTQPDLDKDKPRHIEFYHSFLALGYAEGRVDMSVVGEPYNFSGLDGASSWAIGDSVTGLLNLSGTMLAIFGKKSISAISGNVLDSFSQNTLSPKIGAVEYTVTDMGFPVYANAYGIYTLSQSSNYGDFMGTPLSQDISPWLRPRLIRKNTSDKEVVCAWPVRSKNHYKLAFADGKVLTMTMNNGVQSTPTFSKQEYTLPVYSDDGSLLTSVPLIPAAISSELDDGGEERIHVANKLPVIINYYN